MFYYEIPKEKFIILAAIFTATVVIAVGVTAFSQRKRINEYVIEYTGRKVYVTENGVDGINTYETVYSSSDRRSVWIFDDNVNTVSLVIYENDDIVFKKVIPNPDHYGVPDLPLSDGLNGTIDSWFGYGYRCDLSQADGNIHWDLYNPQEDITPNEKHINTTSDTYLHKYSLKFAENVDKIISSASSLEATVDAQTAYIMKKILNPAYNTVSWGVSNEISALNLARDMTSDELTAALTIYFNALMADSYYLDIMEK